jgi:hypothetical protein
MPFSEDDLRSALKREDPGPEFTQRVMARVAQQEKAVRAPGRDRGGWFAWLRPLRLHPAMAAVAAALVLAVATWMGYQRYQAIQVARAREAEQQAILALRITNAKLNHVFQRVKQSETNDPKIRREVL